MKEIIVFSLIVFIFSSLFYQFYKIDKEITLEISTVDGKEYSSVSITSETPFDADQVQPASLDLRLSDQAWRVRASFLPGQRTVEDRIARILALQNQPEAKWRQSLWV